RQAHFSLGARFQSAIQPNVVEQIIDHRQARFRKARASASVLIGSFFPTESPTQFLTIGQAHQRTVYPYQPVAAPASHGTFGMINRRHNALAVQLDKGARLQFGPRVRHRAASHWLKYFTVSQLIEKLMEMALNRFDGLLQDKKHQQRKSQLSFTGEI